MFQHVCNVPGGEDVLVRRRLERGIDFDETVCVQRQVRGLAQPFGRARLRAPNALVGGDDATALERQFPLLGGNHAVAFDDVHPRLGENI